MSPDTIVSAALLLTALLLMIRPGCGAYMGRTNTQEMSNSHRAGAAGVQSTNKEQ